MVDVPTLILAGLVVGVAYGLFGVGSAVATPVLSLLGVTGMSAVVGPLPALLPGSAAGAWTYARGGKVDWRVARRTLTGAAPAAVVGALASQWVGAPVLLTLSGVVLLAAGMRVLRPGPTAGPGADRAPGQPRRSSSVRRSASGSPRAFWPTVAASCSCRCSSSCSASTSTRRRARA